MKERKILTFKSWINDCDKNTRAIALCDDDDYFVEAINCVRDSQMGDKDENGVYSRKWWADFVWEDEREGGTNPQDYNTNSIGCTSAPTLYMAMEWLREKHKLLISIFPMETAVGIETLCYGIDRITDDLYQPLYSGKVDNLVDSYEELVEEAIRYSLKNLI